MVFDVDVQAPDVFAVAARDDDDRAVDDDRLGRGVVRVAAEDEVDPLDLARDLLVDAEAVVREHDDAVDLVLVTQFVDVFLQRIQAQPEAPPLGELFRVRRRGEGEGLADDADLGPAALLDGVGLENELFVVVGERVVADDVLGDELRVEHVDELFDAFRAVGELPVADHDVDAEVVLCFDDRFAARFKGDARSLPGVAGVEQQHLVAAALALDLVDEGLHVRDAAHFAELPGQGREVHVGVEIGVERTRFQAVVLRERFTAQKARRPDEVRRRNERRGFAPVERFDMRVHVADVQQRYVALGIERVQVRQRDVRRVLAADRGGETVGNAHQPQCGRDRKKVSS